MVSLREARPEDATVVRAVFVAAIRAQGPTAYTDEEVAAWLHGHVDDPDYPIEDGAAHFVVAESDNSIVGVGDLDTEAGEARAVYVHPDYVGQGIGTVLLEELESAARANGLDELHLLASLNAVPFYQRHGYERAQTVAHETSAGVELDVELMTKELDRQLRRYTPGS